jgi:hypothetical protein
MTENVYRDTDERYGNDPAFRAAVTMLERAAEQHGFTPGELKQIAFMAALKMRARPLMYISKGEAFELVELQPNEKPVPFRPIAGHLKDGTPVYYGREP